jgi:hypothetical protein
MQRNKATAATKNTCKTRVFRERLKDSNPRPSAWQAVDLRPLGLVPSHVVHPGLLGGWGCHGGAVVRGAGSGALDARPERAPSRRARECSLKAIASAARRHREGEPAPPNATPEAFEIRYGTRRCAGLPRTGDQSVCPAWALCRSDGRSPTPKGFWAAHHGGGITTRPEASIACEEGNRSREAHQPDRPDGGRV